MIKRILAALLLYTVLFLLCSCSEYLNENETESSGEILTPEYMAEISQKLAEDKNTSFETSNDHITSVDTGIVTDNVYITDEADSLSFSTSEQTRKMKILPKMLHRR